MLRFATFRKHILTHLSTFVNSVLQLFLANSKNVIALRNLICYNAYNEMR
nr:MAG TPA: hypothetical protein [Caudoviricetes sp.]